MSGRIASTENEESLYRRACEPLISSVKSAAFSFGGRYDPVESDYNLNERCGDDCSPYDAAEIQGKS